MNKIVIFEEIVIFKETSDKNNKWVINGKNMINEFIWSDKLVQKLLTWNQHITSRWVFRLKRLVFPYRLIEQLVPSNLVILACTRDWFWPCSWCTFCWLASWRIVRWRAWRYVLQKIENLWAKVEYSTFESKVEWSCWCSWLCCGLVTVSAFSKGP